MIVVNYGSDIVKNVYDTLKASDIASYLKTGYSVALKPNLVTARPARDGATTHTEVLEGIIIFLRDFGIRDIRIIESSQVGESTGRSYRNCGYEDLSARFNAPLVDLKSDRTTRLKFKDMDLEVYNEALNTDFLINVPVLKGHSQTRLTCCMKNLKGCIPDSEKRRYHTLGIEKPVAALNGVLKTGYCVVDGMCGDLSFEEGGNPVQANRVIAGRDPVMVDSYCARLIGYRPEDIRHVDYGRQWGIGEFFSGSVPLIELNAENKPLRETKSRLTTDRYKHMIEEDSACSACYASLTYALHRLRGNVKADGKIHIGQGFKGKAGGFGVGVCCAGFARCVPGCPPDAADIVEALSNMK